MPSAGMFLWADTGLDSEGLAAAGHEAGFLLTPGSLFSPQQSPSTMMRFNIANCGDPGLPAMLTDYADRAGETRIGAAHRKRAQTGSIGCRATPRLLKLRRAASCFAEFA
jgi:hypothetical protein